MDHFGKILLARREAEGLTQKQLGERFGVSDQSVSDWEHADSPPLRGLRRKKMAEFLGIPIAQFDARWPRNVRMSEDSADDPIRKGTTMNIIRALTSLNLEGLRATRAAIDQMISDRERETLGKGSKKTVSATG